MNEEWANAQWSVYIWVMLGGALGAASRFAISHAINHHWDKALPLATLLVNLTGCFFITFIMVMLEHKLIQAPFLKPLLLAGFLGAFTTFSTFSLENLTLLQQGEIISALSNILISVFGGLMAAYAGYKFAHFSFS